MKKTILKSIYINNFKNIASAKFDFSEKTEIVADVMQGKSSIKDAYFFALGIDIENFFPLDKNNKPVLGIITLVEIEINVDGLDYVLSRSAKVKYKIDKDTNIKTFDGYKKDIYEFDNAPCSANEYKNKVSNLLGVDDFNMLKCVSVLNYFNEQLDWKSRRNIIYNLFADTKAVEALKESKDYNLLSNELNKGKSTDEINTSINAEMSKLIERKRSNEISIAENMACLSYFSFDESIDYDQAIKDIDKAIEEEKSRLYSINLNEDKLRIEKEISDLNVERLQLEREDNQRKQSLISKVSKLEFESYHIKNIGEMAEQKVSINTKNYKDIKSATFDMKSSVCPTCGREYPQEHIDNLKIKWEEEKQRNLDTYKAEVLKFKSEYENYKDKYTNIMSQIEVAKQEIDNFKPNPKIEQLKTKVLELVATLPSSNSLKDDTKLNALKEKKLSLWEDRSAKQSWTRHKNRIESLKDNQKEVMSAEIALAKKRDQFEKYMVAVINIINDSINKNFCGVAFKLFDVLTTSAKKDIKSTCIVTHNGVDYASQSTGEKANTNCIIVSTLQKALGINTPIWLDDASVLNLTNEPSNQLIYLLNEKGAKLNYSRIRDLY